LPPGAWCAATTKWASLLFLFWALASFLQSRNGTAAAMDERSRQLRVCKLFGLLHLTVRSCRPSQVYVCTEYVMYDVRKVRLVIFRIPYNHSASFCPQSAPSRLYFSDSRASYASHTGKRSFRCSQTQDARHGGHGDRKDLDSCLFPIPPPSQPSRFTTTTTVVTRFVISRFSVGYLQIVMRIPGEMGCLLSMRARVVRRYDPSVMGACAKKVCLAINVCREPVQK